MLRLDRVRAGYGNIPVLHDVSIEVPARGIVALLGANGAGKTTTLRAIARLLTVSAGHVIFDGTNITRIAPEKVVRRGLALVPQGRLLFPQMTVAENLELGAYIRHDRDGVRQDMQKNYDRFPILRDKRDQAAGSLSGGQQQMLAIARSLMSRPKLLMLDEPSLGLAPLVVEDIFNAIRQIRDAGTAILLVEQNAAMALKVADYGFVLEAGTIIVGGSAAELAADKRVQDAYLGEMAVQMQAP